jgi:predicted metal-binding membrane protein
MNAATGLSGARLATRERGILLATTLLVTATLWWLLTADLLISGHALHHTVSPGFIQTFFMWMIMMVAMMLPPVLPWIWFYAATTKANGRSTDTVSWWQTVIFGSGYFLLWGGYSLLATAAQMSMRASGWLNHHLAVSPAAGGIILIVAGLFQLTPLKTACLKHCRSPLAYFMTSYHSGPAGALRMGLGHGLYCLACCWAIMAIAFALGTMNMVWMAAATLILCIEKIAPGGQVFSKVFGLVFVASGVLLLVWG